MLLHCASAVVTVTVFHDDCCTTLFLLLEPGCVAWYKFPYFSFPGLSSGHWTSLFLSLALLGMGFELWPLTFFSKASMSEKVTAPMGVSVGQCSITFVV